MQKESCSVIVFALWWNFDGDFDGTGKNFMLIFGKFEFKHGIYVPSDHLP